MCTRLGGWILALVALAPGLGAQSKGKDLPIDDDDLRRTLIHQRSEETPGDPREEIRSNLPNVDLQMRIKDVQVTTTPAGDVVTLETDEGPVRISAAEFVRSIGLTKAAVEHGGFFYKLFNISRPWGFLWISIGFLGQALFTFRMVLQWWASEKHKRSVVPVAFWWGSLIGGVMLFTYFIWRKDIVGIVGQSTGVFVYARNLVLIYRHRHADAEPMRPVDGVKPGPVTT